MASWTYDTERRTYRSPAGRALSQKQLTDIRNALADFTAEQARTLANQYATGGLALDQWAGEFRRLLEDSTTSGYMLGKGGINAVDLNDLRRIDQLIRTQTDYAAQFARDLHGADLSPEQIGARAQLYAGTAVHAYEAARAAGTGIELPTYPGDGSQDCLGNCRCEWVIEETDTGYEATWQLDPGAMHCQTCLDNAEQYSPYVSEGAPM